MDSLLNALKGLVPDGIGTLVSLVCAMPATLALVQAWRYGKNEKVHNQSLVTKWARLTIGIMIVSIVISLFSLFAIILARDSRDINTNLFIMIPCFLIIAGAALVSLLQIKRNGWWIEFSLEDERGGTILILVVEIIASIMTYLSSMGAALSVLSKKISFAYILKSVYIVIFCFIVETFLLVIWLYVFAWNKCTNKYDQAKVVFTDGEAITIKYKSYRMLNKTIVFEEETSDSIDRRIDIKYDDVKRIEYSLSQDKS